MDGKQREAGPQKEAGEMAVGQTLALSPGVLSLDPEPTGELSLVHSCHLSSGEVGGRDSPYLEVSWPTSLAYLVKV